MIVDSRVFNKRNKKQLLLLKAKIKGFAEESKRIRRFINKSSGSTRYHYWEIKRSLGKEVRLHLLAYGLLRGIPYNQIEPNSNKHLRNYLNYEYLVSIIKHHYGFCGKSLWTVKSVKDLIEKGIYPKKPNLRKLWGKAL